MENLPFVFINTLMIALFVFFVKRFFPPPPRDPSLKDDSEGEAAAKPTEREDGGRPMVAPTFIVGVSQHTGTH